MRLCRGAAVGLSACDADADEAILHLIGIAARIASAWDRMSESARPPVIAWSCDPAPVFASATRVMIVVPVVSKTKPVQKSAKCFGFKVPDRRSAKTPIV